MNNKKSNVSAYVGEITVELAKMARTDGFDMLACLLEMAALEAECANKKQDDVRRR